MIFGLFCTWVLFGLIGVFAVIVIGAIGGLFVGAIERAGTAR